LARYYDNSTYADWADFTWDWLRGHKYITDDWVVWDGAYIETNCTKINELKFSYNTAILMQGAAHMYNYVSRVFFSLSDSVILLAVLLTGVPPPHRNRLEDLTSGRNASTD
jgi:hypothetical protein